MSNCLRTVVVLRSDRVVTVESVVQDQHRCERPSRVEDSHPEHEDDPVGLVIRSQTHHEETTDDQDGGDPEELEAHLWFERSTRSLGLAHTINVADVSSKDGADKESESP